MSDSESNLTENDWSTYYKVLGEFIVDFENVVFAIRKDCSKLLNSKGLRDETIGEIIFGQKFFTSDPLINCYETIVSHILKWSGGNEILCKRLTALRKSFTRLIEARNDIVHSTHFFVESINIIGPPKKVTDFKAFKPSPKKTGYETKRTHRKEVIEYSKQLKSLKKDFDSFIIDLHKFLKEKEGKGIPPSA